MYKLRITKLAVNIHKMCVSGTMVNATRMKRQRRYNKKSLDCRASESKCCQHLWAKVTASILYIYILWRNVKNRVPKICIAKSMNLAIVDSLLDEYLKERITLSLLRHKEVQSNNEELLTFNPY